MLSMRADALEFANADQSVSVTVSCRLQGAIYTHNM